MNGGLSVSMMGHEIIIPPNIFWPFLGIRGEIECQLREFPGRGAGLVA